ncbi:MAG: hypothetical protein ACPLPX_00630 [Candidatus Kapaibacteriota bacterium]
MKIKKFLSRTMQEGKEKILSELGSEAVILSSRIIPPSPPDNEEMIEIVAAIDTEDENVPYLQTSNYSGKKEKWEKTETIEFAANIYKEISYIKNFLFELSDKITFNYISNLPSEYAELAKLMVKNGFSKDFALSFVHHLKVKKYNNSEDLRNDAKIILAEKLKYETDFPKRDKQNIILFVGPTGSGKTLNLIKIGILYKVLLNAKVAVVSIDFKKIGGWEQLQMLCAISNLFCAFVNSTDELSEQIDSLKTYDFILVDTSGGSPRDENFISEIQEISEKITWTSKIVVLSATKDKLNFSLNLLAFKRVKPNYILLSKLDEVTTIGHIYEPLLEVTTDVPLLYCSTGIDIPNSIEPATAELISQYLINNVE